MKISGTALRRLLACPCMAVRRRTERCCLCFSGDGRAEGRAGSVLRVVVWWCAVWKQEREGDRVVMRVCVGVCCVLC